MADAYLKRKTGSETFKSNGDSLPICLSEFWQWSASDLVSNATRGVLAEFVVASALGIEIKKDVRKEWGTFDLTTGSGVRVEVKSSGYVQTWKQKRLSRICFSVRPSRAFDEQTNEYARDSIRQADVYIFALLHHVDKATIDPLDLSQWSFYAVKTDVLNQRLGSSKSISLKTLETMSAAVEYSSLGVCFNQIVDSQEATRDSSTESHASAAKAGGE